MHSRSACIFVLCGLLPFVLGTSLSGPEQTFFNLPDPAQTREHLQYYTSSPHLAGSQRDYETAVYTHDKFVEYGLSDVVIHTQHVVANFPLQRELELRKADGTVLFTAGLYEPPLVEDPYDPAEDPTFNMFSGSGTVTNRIVYANYGSLDDFNYLKNNGVDLKGALVLTRYGPTYRGIKAFLAEQFGAAGLLIYSDPQQDGFDAGGVEHPVYPEGKWRPELSVQRGCLVYWQYCPGSPSQERMGLCLGEEFADASPAGNLYPTIPVLPISWGDAYPILQDIANNPNGLAAPSTWQGGLNFTYKAGPSVNQVYLNVQMNTTNTTIWTVTGTFRGQSSNEAVLVGNHRDAWGKGGSDPSSGTSILLEIIRSLRVLANTTGWVPKRDIYFGSWDGEEYGIMGSTTWAEDNEVFLKDTLMAYLNVDIGACGPLLNIRGTPNLLNVIKDVASQIPDPSDSTKKLTDFWTNDQLVVLGSGSDFVPFIDFLGVPSVDFYYSSSPGANEVYHSIYDSFAWMDQFGDPGYIKSVALARLIGILAIRFADDIVIPLNFSNYAGQLQTYLTTIQQQVATGLPGTYDYSPLQNAITQFKTAAAAIDGEAACVRSSGSATGCTSDLNELNRRLQIAERSFLINSKTNSSDGLPKRNWHKHVVQAAGILDGYGAQIFPGIAQGIVDNNPALIQQQIGRAADTILNVVEALTPAGSKK
uniref:Poly(L-malate)-hydrolase n=1 Tax=Physarum polycephalum TaxID=5791 RepID=Q70U68_PHYPO|nr:poly(L-malate)-hydrolase precursor [Physarum polycephalum]